MPGWSLECLADGGASSPDIIEALNGLLIVPTGQEQGSLRLSRLDPGKSCPSSQHRKLTSLLLDEFYVRSKFHDFFVEGRVSHHSRYTRNFDR